LVKWPTTRPVGAPFGSHLAFAAKALGFGQGGLDVGHADVEDDVAGVVGTSADAAGDAGPVRGRCRRRCRPRLPTRDVHLGGELAGGRETMRSAECSVWEEIDEATS
jgi:hypothetical protein